MKVCFITFGCRLNRAEALDEEARYLAAGWQLTDNHAEADRFVVRGCSVTRRAQHDCEKLIAHLKRKYPTSPIDVQGCLKSPLRRKASPIKDLAISPVPTRTARAFLKIQDGCSGKCTFCIVPKFRGNSVSTDFDAVLARAREFIAAGYREIVLTGCNLVLYASRGKRLGDLLAALADLGANAETPCRFRLGSIEPGPVAEEVVRVMADHSNVCRYLHLPIQSGSNFVLANMRRPYQVKTIESVVSLATSLMPNLGLGCDLMAGFPGESDLDHTSTKSLVARLPFNKAHVFSYSERPGTTAQKMAASIPHGVRTHRAHELMRLVDAKRTAFAQSFVGREVDVIIENEERQEGRTSEYLLFSRARETSAEERVARKELAHFRVDSFHGHLLRG